MPQIMRCRPDTTHSNHADHLVQPRTSLRRHRAAALKPESARVCERRDQIRGGMGVNIHQDTLYERQLTLRHDDSGG